MMNGEIKAKWCAALRSGKFDQKPGYLRVVNLSDTVVGYCCLGVLREITNPGKTYTDEGTSILEHDDAHGLDRGDMEILAKMNDGNGPDCKRWTFAEIADYLEQHQEI